MLWRCLPDVLDTNSIQLVEHLKEVLYRAGDPVRSPDENNIEAAAAGIGQHLIETWPLRFSARKPVGILIDDLVAALSSHLPQIDELRFRMLIDGRYAHVKRRRASCAPALPGRDGSILGNVALDEIEEHDCHFQALRRGCGLEAVMQIGRNVDVHSLDS